MSKRLYFSNQEIIQQGKVLFETIEKNTKVAEKLDEYGYSEEEIKKGKALYDIVLDKVGTNKKETEEEKLAYLKFKQKMDEVSLQYKEHRNKAKLIFKTNEEAKVSLALKGSPSKAIIALLDQMNNFYKALDEKNELQTPLQRVKITPESIEKQLKNISQVRNLYAKYSQEKNESEQATKDKNKALAEFDKWVRELYSYAKYALADDKQFLQIFGKIIP